MTFDGYYEATDKKLMELSYTESDDFKRRDASWYISSHSCSPFFLLFDD